MSAAKRAGLSPARLANLDRLLKEKYVDTGRLPGTLTQVWRRGELAYTSLVGSMDLERKTPMREDAIFRIYSMTKPIVSVAVMMLVEEGRFVLSDPISIFLPALSKRQVAIPQAGGGMTLEPSRAEITIHDLLRHTSGLTYPFRSSHLMKAYADAEGTTIHQKTNAEVVAMLGTLPLVCHPGSAWEYSRSTDVLGHLVEVISGRTLGEFLRERVLGPLGMDETGFHVPEAKWSRIAEAGPDEVSGQVLPAWPVRHPPKFEMGGGGLVSTAGDYVRFAQMLLNGGELEGVRLLGPKTLAWMTADHLGSIPRRALYYPGPGYGFGLGFAVRSEAGISSMQGSSGEYYWTGAAGTSFWVDPRERLIGIAMIQVAPNPQVLARHWWKARSLVMQSIVE